MIKKAGYVAVVGLPNAGKSSLVNHLTKEKVSITSNKPQTTRQNVLGILTENNTQYVFVDAPGFIQSDKGLNGFLESEWRSAIEDADLLVFTFNLDAKKDSFEKTLTMMDSISVPKVAVITKTDLDHKKRELILEQEMQKREVRYFKSRRKGKTQHLEITPGFLEEIQSHLPQAEEFYFDPETYTTQTMREISKETILENIFRFLNEEVPYEIGVNVREFSEGPKIYKIYADILVSKERYKKMVIGKGGATIKKLGMLSRKALENQFSTKIFLDLRVKNRDNWNKNPRMLKELGYDIKRK